MPSFFILCPIKWIPKYRKFLKIQHHKDTAKTNTFIQQQFTQTKKSSKATRQTKIMGPSDKMEGKAKKSRLRIPIKSQIPYYMLIH